jgi:cytochrome c553
MRPLLASIAALLLMIGGAAAQSAAPAGASSCSGCHDAKNAGTSLPPLKGRPAAEIVSAMQDFREGKREATVMGRIAKGFSEEETRAIAAWLGQR